MKVITGHPQIKKIGQKIFGQKIFDHKKYVAKMLYIKKIEQKTFLTKTIHGQIRLSTKWTLKDKSIKNSLISINPIISWYEYF